jgi:hypothetical protein
LEEECIAPVWSSVERCFPTRQEHCHYNATAALNLLLANYHSFNQASYVLEGGDKLFAANDTTWVKVKHFPELCVTGVDVTQVTTAADD